MGNCKMIILKNSILLLVFFFIANFTSNESRIGSLGGSSLLEGRNLVDDLYHRVLDNKPSRPYADDVKKVMNSSEVLCETCAEKSVEFAVIMAGSPKNMKNSDEYVSKTKQVAELRVVCRACL